MNLLAHLETFVRIVESGSLSGAAKALGLSLPAVSRQLRSLEEELGVTLVVRSTRRLSVTDDGRQWYERGARVLRELEDARRLTGADGETRGRLVVSAPITLGAHCVVPRLPALRRAHPGLAIELRLEDRIVDLVGDGVDVAIRAGIPLPDSTAFVGHPLFEFRRWVVASPSYLRRHGSIREPDQLANHECLTHNAATGPNSRWRFAGDGEDRGVEVRGAICTNAPLVLLELAREGLGVACLPEWLVEGDVESGRLRRILASWDTPLVKTFALHRAELRGSPRIAALLNVLRQS